MQRLTGIRGKALLLSPNEDHGLEDTHVYEAAPVGAIDLGPNLCEGIASSIAALTAQGRCPTLGKPSLNPARKRGQQHGGAPTLLRHCAVRNGRLTPHSYGGQEDPRVPAPRLKAVRHGPDAAPRQGLACPCKLLQRSDERPSKGPFEDSGASATENWFCSRPETVEGNSRPSAVS